MSCSIPGHFLQPGDVTALQIYSVLYVALREALRLSQFVESFANVHGRMPPNLSVRCDRDAHRVYQNGVCVGGESQPNATLHAGARVWDRSEV